MPGGARLEVEFTAILYGVVTANALVLLEFGWVIKNFAILFAILIILDDWVDYTLSTDIAEANPRKHLLSYVIDVTTLVVWYLLTIVPMSERVWYVGFVTAFFFLQGLWDVAVLDQYGLREVLLVRPYWHLSIAYAGLIAVHTLVYRLTAVQLLTACFLIFFVRKGYFWYHWYGTAGGEQVFTEI